MSSTRLIKAFEIVRREAADVNGGDFAARHAVEDAWWSPASSSAMATLGRAAMARCADSACDSTDGIVACMSGQALRRVTLHPSAVALGVHKRRSEVRLIMLQTIDQTWPHQLNVSVS